MFYQTIKICFKKKIAFFFHQWPISFFLFFVYFFIRRKAANAKFSEIVTVVSDRKTFSTWQSNSNGMLYNSFYTQRRYLSPQISDFRHRWIKSTEIWEKNLMAISLRLTIIQDPCREQATNTASPLTIKINV